MLQTRAPLRRQNTPAHQRFEGGQPLPDRLGWLVFEQALQRVTVALAGRLGGLQLSGNIEPDREGGIWHALIMHEDNVATQDP